MINNLAIDEAWELQRYLENNGFSHKLLPDPDNDCGWCVLTDREIGGDK